MSTAPYFLGIDVGTQGCRVVLIDSTGRQVDAASAAFPITASSLQEQSPDDWWQCCTQLIRTITKNNAPNIPMQEILAVSVTSTSGTVIPLDANHRPLHAAIMYSDKRSSAEGDLCRSLALRYAPTQYTGFNSSSGLSKMIWLIRQYPAKAKLIGLWAHASDYIIGKLSGSWGVTDYTNVLKSGFDLARKQWPGYLFRELGLREEWMPAVVAPGEIIATIDPAIAKETGLHRGTLVVSGMTDGCASQVASGAAQVGDWNTTIGTTLVVKGITTEPVTDPGASLYNHLHPQGYWMPGGASNIGADWVSKRFGSDLDALNEHANEIIPTGLNTYPLDGVGERFPFVSPDAKGFAAAAMSDVQCFASSMEGVAFIERYAYETIEKLSGEKVRAVYMAGGASNSDTWCRIRCNVLDLPMYKMEQVTGSFGAAVLAASGTHFTSLTEATQQLSTPGKEYHPEKNMREQYNDHYHSFIEELRKRDYI